MSPTSPSFPDQPESLAYAVTPIGDVDDDARFPWETLTGTPRPATPLAISSALWRAVREQRTFVGYLDAVDEAGTSRAELAAVTPLDDVLLTVRVRPGCPDLLTASRALHDRVLPVERAFIAAGADDTTIRHASEAQLEAVVEELGEPTYDHWSAKVLPDEVLGRSANRGRLPWPTGGTGILRTLTNETRWLHQLVSRWAVRADAVQHVLDVVDAVGRRLEVAAMANAHQAAAFRAVLTLDPHASSIAEPIEAWLALRDEEQAGVALVNEVVDELPTPVAEARFQVALAALHSEAAGQCAADHVSGRTDAAETRRVVVSLVDSLGRVLPEAGAILQHTHDVADQVAEELESLLALVMDGNAQLQRWLDEHGPTPSDIAERLRPEVRDALQRGREDERMLGSLIDRCRRIGTVDAAEALTQVETVRELAVRLTNPDA